MSGFGFGSFLEGLADGMQTGQALAARQTARELEERRLQIQEDAARREAENSAYNRSVSEKKMKWLEEDRARELESDKANRAWTEKQHGWTEQDRARAEADRAANAPLVETTRKSSLLEQENKLSDQQSNKEIRDIRESSVKDYEGLKAKSILQAADETGKLSYTVDDQKYGTKEDAEKAFEAKHPFWSHFNANTRPKLVERLIAAGKYQEADATEKFFSDKKTANGLEQTGRLLEAMDAGDIEGVKKHLGAITKDPNYLIQDGYDIKTDFARDDKGNVIKGEDGKPLGLKMTMTNKQTGQSFEEQAIGKADIITKMGWITDPASAVTWNMKQVERIRAQKAEEAKKGIDLAADMQKEDAKADNELRKQIDKEMNDANDRNTLSMTPEQKQAEFNRRYNLARKPIQPTSPATSGGIPTMTWGPGR